MSVNLLEYFTKPMSERQKQYETVRAVVIENLPVDDAARKFNYKRSTVYSLLRDAKAGKIEFFPKVKKGPKGTRVSIEIQDKIERYRQEGLSTTDIHNKLKSDEGIVVSVRTIERILKDKGYERLKKRSNRELGKTKKDTIIPERSLSLNFKELSPFKVDCPCAGVFFFIPYIIESRIIDIVKQCKLPESNDIGSVQASLSMLLLKLIGNNRLSNVYQYDHEPGFGVFSGLNVLPKPTYMCTYSCRCTESELMNLQSNVVSLFREKYPSLYGSDYINLDFHSIPHYGDESEMEKVWCGAKGRAIKGANTVFVTDSESNVVIYARSDILRKEEALEVKKFVEYYRSIKGSIDETLVFDCKFTSYNVLKYIS